MLASYYAGGKIMICGNGGSCADSSHIVGELMKGFLNKRKMSAAADGKIMRKNGKWYVLGGIYNRYPDDVISVSEPSKGIEKFTEENVIKLINERGFLSASIIQRCFQVGYGQAATMIDALTEKGYVKFNPQKWIPNDDKS